MRQGLYRIPVKVYELLEEKRVARIKEWQWLTTYQEMADEIGINIYTMHSIWRKGQKYCELKTLYRLLEWLNEHDWLDIIKIMKECNMPCLPFNHWSLNYSERVKDTMKYNNHSFSDIAKLTGDKLSPYTFKEIVGNEIGRIIRPSTGDLLEEYIQNYQYGPEDFKCPFEPKFPSKVVPEYKPEQPQPKQTEAKVRVFLMKGDSYAPKVQ